MAIGLRGDEPDARQEYADIIDMPHHQSSIHPHMSIYDRAAQFMPFAALSGYDEMIHEETRTTDSKKELDDFITDVISQKLNIISNAIISGNYPVVDITYFVPDSNKEGGKYITSKVKIKRIDLINRKVMLMRSIEGSHANCTIDIANITDISGDIVEYIDDWI